MGGDEIMDGAIRRVVIIGNGFAGAENQSVGLVRALGLSNRLSLYVSFHSFLLFSHYVIDIQFSYVLWLRCIAARYETSRRNQ